MLKAPEFPLTVPGALAAMVGGCFAGVLLDDLYSALAVFTLIASCSLVWRQDDPPVLPFILVFQWTSVTAGYWYAKVFGTFPGFYRPGDVERTMTLALFGLLTLAVGMRLVMQWLGARHRPRAGDAPPDQLSTIWPLFWVVMAT
jgi:hypothetical protein